MLEAVSTMLFYEETVIEYVSHYEALANSCLILISLSITEGGGAAGGYQQQGAYGQQAYGGYQQQQAYGGYQAPAPAAYGQTGGYQAPGYQNSYQAPQASAYGGVPSGYPPAPAAAAGPWKSATAADGQTYYYNEQTGATQWEKPAGMP
jgi:hypothetical protein